MPKNLKFFGLNTGSRWEGDKQTRTVHRDTGNIPAAPLLTICIGPPTSGPHKGLANIVNDEKKVITIFF